MPDDQIPNELLAEGISPRRANEISARFPHARDSIIRWIEEAAAQGASWRANHLIYLAAALQIPDLGRVICSLLQKGLAGLNVEDMVDILGDVGGADSVPFIWRSVQESVGADGPGYWLCQKAVVSLVNIGSVEALGHVQSMTGEEWPDPVRWHAAYSLGIEDDLGFSEVEMLG